MNTSLARNAVKSTAVEPPFRYWRTIVTLSLLSIVAAYWPTLVSMAHTWDTSNTYAHGWLIAPISLYFLYQARGHLAAAPQSLCWWALLPIGAGGAAWALATLAEIQVVQQLAVVTLAVGVVLFLMGWRWSVVALFPLAFLYLAVPLGDGLVPHMIDLTADFVVAALRVSGIPVYRDGTYFVIPSGSWSVVSGCSGMRYLMATVTVGILFAHLNYRSFWRKLVFVALAVIVAFVANWLRAYGIVMIAHLSDMKLALGVDHYIYGWVFFGIIIFLLMLIGSLFSDRGNEPDPAPAAPAPRARPRALLPALFVLALAVHLWPVATRALIASAPVATPEAAALGVAFGTETAPPPALDWTPHYVGEPALRNGGFANEDAGWHVAWYPLQRQGVELIYAGNYLVHEKYDPWRPQSRQLRETGSPAVPMVIETLLRSRSSARSILVWQWYWVAGRVTVNPLIAKLYGILGQLEGNGNPGASVLIYRLVSDDTMQTSAREFLDRKLARVAPAVLATFAHTINP